MLRPPTEQEIFNFVNATHAVDRINLYAEQLTNTWNQKGKPNPFAQGHFRAHMYIVNTLLPSADFPAKAPDLLHTVRDSDNALFWLRTIHHKMADPLVGHELLSDDPNAPTSNQIGKYRLSPAMAVQRPAPEPSAIPLLMHNWIVKYAKFHEKVKDRVENPYGLDKETALEIVNMGHDINLFFCVVQPMSCLNQRMGRFLENTFRLAWRLPLRIYSPNSDDYRRLPAEIEYFETNLLPKLVQDIKNVRG